MKRIDALAFAIAVTVLALGILWALVVTLPVTH